MKAEELRQKAKDELGKLLKDYQERQRQLKGKPLRPSELCRIWYKNTTGSLP